MKILEATWQAQGELVVWGQKSARTGAAYCTAQEIADALRLLDAPTGVPGETDLLLPHGTFSPRILHSEASSESVALSAVRVCCHRFSPLDAASLLTVIPSEAPTGVAFDDSLLFWVEATKHLLELLTLGHFLPGLRRERGTLFARWEPLLNVGENQRRFDRLARLMPPAARCCAAFVSEPPAALRSFFDQCGDALIRYFLARHPLTESSEGGCGERWLAALTSPDARIDEEPRALLRLESQLRQWRLPLFRQARRQPLTVAFHLRTPAAARDPWVVEFALHGRADTRDALPAADLWLGQLGFLKQSDYRPEELEETLLKGLGSAVHLFGALKRALFDAAPSRLELTLDEAYRFLKEESSLLEEAGYPVVLPAWWRERLEQVGLKLRLRSAAQRPTLLGFDQLLDYSWQLAIGEQTIDAAEFRALSSANSPLVFLRGRWFELPPEKLRATVRFLESHDGEDKIRVLDALRAGFSLSEREDLLPVVGIEATGWVQQLLEATEAGVPLREQPAQFQGVLRPYQLEGLSWLCLLSQAGVGGCLADDMGLGKTIQLLALLLAERSTSGETPLRPTLLVVPMSILGNWSSEAARFAPSLRFHLHHGPLRLSGEAFLRTAACVDLVITTYSLAYRDEALLARISWGRIALDEAQNIKNLNTKQTQAIRRLTFAQAARGADSCHRLALTGTPLENHLDELWSIFDFLNSGYLGELSEFRRRFSVPIERYRNREAADALARVIRPFILRRLKSDARVISDLPEKIEMDEPVALSPEQAALYQRVLGEMLPKVEQATGIHRKGLVLAAITRLKQICDHPALLTDSGTLSPARSGKLARLEEILEVVLDEGDKVLIFSQFAQMGELLRRRLEERFREEVLFLHGALSRQARDKVVSRFQTVGGPRLFVLSLKAGGYGLNLTEANQIIHYDQWWNPAVQQQATDRAYRIGQRRCVQVRSFISRGTLEEKIAALLTHKRQLATSIVASTRSFLTELSTAELKQILSLQTELSELDEWKEEYDDTREEAPLSLVE